MEIAENRMECFNLLHSDHNVSLVCDYQQYLRTLVNFTQSSKYMDAVLLGYGCNGILCHLRESSFGGGYFSLQAQCGAMQLYHIHKPSIVLEDSSLQYKENYALLLYKASTSSPGAVKMYMSARTRTLILNDAKYGEVWPLVDSIVIRSDDLGVPKFYLSSKLFCDAFHQESVSKSRKKLILFEHPPVALRERTPDANSESPESHGRSLWYDLEKDCVHGIQVVPSFRCQGWPQEALSWASRAREWPPPDIVQRVLKQGVLLVPFHPDVLVSNVRADSDLYWKLDFAEAELILVDNLTAGPKNTLLLCLSLLDRENSRACELLVTTFFWLLEREAPPFWTSGTVSKRAAAVFTLLGTFIGEGCVPHYFLEEHNLLRDTDFALGSLKETLARLAEEEGILAEVKQVLPESVQSHVTSGLKKRLLCVAEKNAEMLLLQLYQRLHNTSWVASGIRLHEDMLQVLQKNRQDPNTDNRLVELVDGVLDVVTLSLSIMYSKKSQVSFFAKEKAFYTRKARDCLACISLREDSVNLLLHEAVYHFIHGEYKRVVNILHPVMTELCVEEVGESTDERPTGSRIAISNDGSNPTSSSTMMDLLVTMTLNKLKTLDFMCSNLDRSVLPGKLGKNMSLAANQFLGCCSCAVGTYQAYFVAGYLLALALHHGRQGSAISDVMLKVEDLTLRDQADMNEKRNVAYLNLLADVYLAIGDKEQAIYLLERSVKILPNPRNYARWTLFGIKNERSRYIALGSIGLLLATAAAAVAIKMTR